MPKRKRPYRTLKEWRVANFPNQEAAAAALSLNQGHYSKIERARVPPRAPLAKVISDKTGVPLETILGLD
jgi:transcriptional regulator with XRE-family HTH domain